MLLLVDYTFYMFEHWKVPVSQSNSSAADEKLKGSAIGLMTGPK